MVDPQNDILSNPIKRQKLAEISSLLDQQSPDNLTSALNVGGNAGDTRNGLKTDRSDESGQLHNIPKDSIPILEDPYEVRDFFTDLSVNGNKSFRNKVKNIINLFPPPFPPVLTSQDIPEDEDGEDIHNGPKDGPTNNTHEVNDNDYTYNDPQYIHNPRQYRMDDGDNNDKGIMIPFIYPPPPVIKPDPLIDDNRPFVRKRGPVPHKNNFDNMVELAPLPFPPLNYMPYPLNANKSSLLPHDVFADFLEASEILPRIDMVVASAAGSLFDLKLQAENEGFTIEKFNKEKAFEEANKRLMVDYDSKKDGEDFNSDGDFDRGETTKEEEDVLCYYENINISNEFDKYNKFDEFVEENQVLLDNYPTLNINSTLSDVKNKLNESEKEDDEKFNCDIDYKEHVIQNFPEVAELIRDSNHLNQKESQGSSSRGNRKKASEHRESKRLSILNALSEVEHFEQDHESEMYKIEKNKLLEEIEQLQNSRVYLIDEDNKFIHHEGLANFKKHQSEERDLDLLKLKLQTNYDILRLLTTFYQDSNRLFSKFNSSTLSKLIKLRNFFEFQCNHINNLLRENNQHSNKAFQDLTDLSSKESAKIFSDFTDRNYASELKEILKLSILKTENPRGSQKIKAQLFKSIEDLSINKFNLNDDLNRFNDINDYNPLISNSEFEMITGNVFGSKPSTKGSGNKNSNMTFKHEIFKHAIYDTSGSDSNSSAYNSKYGNGSSTGGAATVSLNNNNMANNSSSVSNNDLPKRRGRRVNGLEVDEENLNSETYLLAKILKHFIGPQSISPDQLQEDYENMGVKSRWK